MMNIKHPAHRPKRNIMKTPAEEEPARGLEGPLPVLHCLESLSNSSLGLQRGHRVEEEEDHEEDDVSPPDDRVAQQEDSVLNTFVSGRHYCKVCSERYFLAFILLVFFFLDLRLCVNIRSGSFFPRTFFIARFLRNFFVLLLGRTTAP